MDPMTTSIGILAVLYGLYAAWARVKKPHQFAKLEAMKKRFGGKAGMAVHFFSYTLVPIGFGIAMIARGLRGGSLFR